MSVYVAAAVYLLNKPLLHQMSELLLLCFLHIHVTVTVLIHCSCHFSIFLCLSVCVFLSPSLAEKKPFVLCRKP